MKKLILFNKPFNVLSQFTDQEGRATLKDYIQLKNVYPAGRLDKDSEGLLLLTDDGKLQAEISSPKFKWEKVYWVQVENIPSPSALTALIDGVMLKDGIARAKSVSLISEPKLWPRVPPIRERKPIPTSWLEIIITEGRNRQVRRMTAAIGHPTLRLIRQRIGAYDLGELQPGEYKLISN